MRVIDEGLVTVLVAAGDIVAEGCLPVQLSEIEK